MSVDQDLGTPRAAPTSAPDPQPTTVTAKIELIVDLALEATGRRSWPTSRRWPWPSCDSPPGPRSGQTVKATDVDVYAAEPDQPVPGPPIWREDCARRPVGSASRAASRAARTANRGLCAARPASPAASARPVEPGGRRRGCGPGRAQRPVGRP